MRLAQGIIDVFGGHGGCSRRRRCGQIVDERHLGCRFSGNGYAFRNLYIADLAGTVQYAVHRVPAADIQTAARDNQVAGRIKIKVAGSRIVLLFAVRHDKVAFLLDRQVGASAGRLVTAGFRYGIHRRQGDSHADLDGIGTAAIAAGTGCTLHRLAHHVLKRRPAALVADRIDVGYVGANYVHGGLLGIETCHGRG